MVVQTLHDLGILDDTVAQAVLAGPFETLGFDFYEFVTFGAALGANLGRVLPFIYVTANHASEFLLHNG